MKWFGRLYYSFPVRLLLLHFKKHLFLLFLWLSLFAIITRNLGGVFGLHYLFLDPEYLGRVGMVSFFMIGLALGVFIMTFQVTSYILNSFRFPFLASLRSPFLAYGINNSILPLTFSITYILLIVRFQARSEFAESGSTVLNIMALLAGTLLMIGLAATYFFSTNKNIFKVVGKSFRKGSPASVGIERAPELRWEKVQKRSRVWRVDHFISRHFRLRPVRGVEHYDERDLLAVFRQHHNNALFVELLALGFLVLLGYFIDNPLFIIPAGASLLVLFSSLMMLIGAFSYWTAGWRTTMFIILAIVFSLLLKYGLINYRNPAYGLDYGAQKPEYSTETLFKLNTDSIMTHDRMYTLRILENWYRKCTRGQLPGYKPDMVFLNASGGGLRASLWTMQVLRKADSLTRGNLFRHSILMTGASGGMLGMAYYRELWLRNLQGEPFDPWDRQYLADISGDLLNPVTFTIAVNDLFYPWRRFRYGPYSYRKDRAYMFEKQFNINTRHLLDKPLAAYRSPEKQALIPLLILSPTIIQDERKLYISPQPVSYLSCPAGRIVDTSINMIDGIDFGALLHDADAYNLRFTSALRMNATYPYILPNVFLPTHPPVEIMDAGIRDNFGLETSVRFIFNFIDWINEHVNRVIILNINSVNMEMLDYKLEEKQNIFKRLFNPVGNLYKNWTEIQHYNQLYLAQYASRWLNGRLEFIEFNYIPTKSDQTASMSLHLTTREKQDILQAIDLPLNQRSLKKLQQLLGGK